MIYYWNRIFFFVLFLQVTKFSFATKLRWICRRDASSISYIYSSISNMTNRFLSHDLKFHKKNWSHFIDKKFLFSFWHHHYQPKIIFISLFTHSMANSEGKKGKITDYNMNLIDFHCYLSEDLRNKNKLVRKFLIIVKGRSKRKKLEAKTNSMEQIEQRKKTVWFTLNC